MGQSEHCSGPALGQADKCSGPALGQADKCSGPALGQADHCSLGWSDFEKIKSYTFFIVPNCCRTPIPKFRLFMLLLILVAGPQKIWTITIK